MKAPLKADILTVHVEMRSTELLRHALPHVDQKTRTSFRAQFCALQPRL